MNKWDKRFLELALIVSKWSKDESKKVGAVIADYNNKIISVGYNGLPKGIQDNDRLKDKEWKNKRILHAEHNAILNAKGDVFGYKIYCTHMPCTHCSSIIIQSGILEVIVPVQEPRHMTKWGTEGIEMLEEANVDVSIIR